MKFLFLMFLVYLGYRVFLPKADHISVANKQEELNDGDFIDYEEVE